LWGWGSSLGVTCGSICFGEEFSEAGDSCFGVKEVGWDYVLFVGLDLRIIGVSQVSKDVVILICGIGDSLPMSPIQGICTRIMSYFLAVLFRLVWVLRFKCWVLFWSVLIGFVVYWVNINLLCCPCLCYLYIMIC
jgi:hypothetical protein